MEKVSKETVVSKSFLECSKAIRSRMAKFTCLDKFKNALDGWIKEKEFVYKYEVERYENGKKFEDIITEIYREYVRSK